MIILDRKDILREFRMYSVQVEPKHQYSLLIEIMKFLINIEYRYPLMFSKEDELGLHRSGVLAFHALEPSDPDLRGDDQCIVVSVRMKVSGTYGGLEFRSDLRYTRVWRSSPDGTWQLVVAHSSSVV